MDAADLIEDNIVTTDHVDYSEEQPKDEYVFVVK